MKPLNIGFGNIIFEERIIAIVSPEAAPIKRLISEAKDNGVCIDATCGRKTKSVIIMDSSHLLLSGISIEVLNDRLGLDKEKEIWNE